MAEIWLIARRKDRLEALAETLETKCRCLAFDLTDEEALNALEAEVTTAKMVVTYLVSRGEGLWGTGREVENRHVDGGMTGERGYVAEKLCI